MKSNQAELNTVGGVLPAERPGSPGRLALFVATLLLAVSASVGCSPFRSLRENLQYNDAMNDFVMGWRNSAWARQAWHEHKCLFVGEPQIEAFGQGFRDGYADVAGGGSGCVPALPPRSYWTWKYQTAEGQAKVAAWFAGYPHGARAAQEDGAGNFQQIQVSHLIEAQYSPEFQQGKCPDTGGFPCPPEAEYELLPDSNDPAPLPSPGVTSPPADKPAPPKDSTSFRMPAPDWSNDPRFQIQRIASPEPPFNPGAVVPASYYELPGQP